MPPAQFLSFPWTLLVTQGLLNLSAAVRACAQRPPAATCSEDESSLASQKGPVPHLLLRGLRASGGTPGLDSNPCAPMARSLVRRHSRAAPQPPCTCKRVQLNPTSDSVTKGVPPNSPLHCLWETRGPRIESPAQSDCRGLWWLPVAWGPIKLSVLRARIQSECVTLCFSSSHMMRSQKSLKKGATFQIQGSAPTWCLTLFPAP